jgi:hypothetical protein
MKATSTGKPITIVMDMSAYTNGTPYELQLLCSDNPGGAGRLMNFTVDGTLALSGFDPQALISSAGGYSGSTITKGAVATIFGTTTSGNLTVQVSTDTGSPNANALISGLTLAVIPEPSSLALLGLAGLLSILRRRQ